MKINKYQYNEFVLFNKIKNIVIFSIPALIVIGCGSKGCKYPEDTREGGIWETSMITTVKPINKYIIKSETADGAYKIYDGVTESKARENLWVPMKFNNGDYVTVKAGNKIRLNVDNSVVLSGSINTFDIKLSQILSVDGERYSSPNAEKKKTEFSNKKPESTTIKTIFKQNGDKELSYSFDVDTGGGITATVIDKSTETENKVTNIDNACKNTDTSPDNSINYAFYFVKKIFFEKFPKVSGTSVTLVKNITINDPSCGVESDGTRLWYYCEFTYSGEKYKYRRRVTPTTYGNTYVNFEEQIVSLSHPLVYTSNSSSNNSDSEDNNEKLEYNCADEDTACMEQFTEKLKKQSASSLKEESKRTYYLMCIKSGDTSLYSDISTGNNQAGMCSNFNGIEADSKKEDFFDNGNKNTYRHIIYEVSHSPIRIYFKTYNEIYKDNQKSPTTYFGNIKDITFQKFPQLLETEVEVIDSETNKKIKKKTYDVTLINNVVINATSSNMTCGQEKDDNEISWSYCQFTYNNKKYKYRKRLSPVNSNNNAIINYEEQILSVSHPLTYTNDKESNEMLLDTQSKQHYYLMCIRNGNINNYNTKDKYDELNSICENFNGLEANNSISTFSGNNTIVEIKDSTNNKTTYQTKDDYRHIIYSTTTNFAKITYKTDGFPLSALQDTPHRVLNTTKNKQYNGQTIKFPTLCRIFPESVSYQLHKINIKESKWITTDGTPHDIERCTRDCIDLCATYFVEDSSLSIHCSKVGWCIGNDEKFARYVPINYDASSIANKSIANTGCSCTNIGHSFEEIKRDNKTYREKVIGICNHGNNSWYGLIAKNKDNTASSGTLDYEVIGKNISTSNTYSGSFTIAKILTYYNGSGVNGVKISYGICSPYAKNKGYCENVSSAEQCGNNGDCTSIGNFTFNPSYYYDPKEEETEETKKCPGTCIYYTYKDDGLSSINETKTDIRSMVRIDYRNKKKINNEGIRKGTNYNDSNNTIYYVLNDDENNITVDDTDVVIRKGFLPIASEEITNISCVDAELPVPYYEIEKNLVKKPDDFDPNTVSEENLKEAGTSKQELLSTFQNDNCKISGYYTQIIPSNKITYSKNTRGLIPMQYTNISFKKQASIPVKITTTNPIKVKTKTCINEDDPYCYVELKGGQGLVAFITGEDDAYGNGYSDTDMWQCNMGGGGSYAKYRPYHSTSSTLKTRYNPRQIVTSNQLWWECEDELSMWFSGYDYINIKTGKPVQFHRYNVNDLNTFLPSFTEQEEQEPEPEDTSVEAVGCNSNGLPSKMVIDGKTISGDKILSIIYDETEGAKYTYNDGESIKSIGIYDTKITKKVYETYNPHLITANLTDLGLDFVTLTNTENDLKREYENTNTKIKAYYTFKYNGIEYKIGNGAIPIESKNVTFASCYNQDEKPKEKTLSEDKLEKDVTELKKLRFDEMSKYYKYSKEKQTLFTRYGPFTGFAESSTDIISPTVYKTQGMCRGKYQFVYDEQHGSSPEGHTHVATYLGYPNTNTPRYNLSKSWRIEFNTPKIENTTTNDNDANANSGTNSACYTNTTTECEYGEIPSIMIVNLNDTEEYINNNQTDNTGTKVIYKDENSISYINKDYYTVKSPIFGNNDYELMVKDKMIHSITCGGFENCNANEIPVIKITKNGKKYVLVNGSVENIESDEGEIVERATISSRKQRRYYSFEYKIRNYTMKEDKVKSKDTICFKNTSSCKSYLSQYISGSTNVDGKYVYDLDRAPYIITCGNQQNETNKAFRHVYSQTNDGNYVVGADYDKSAIVMQSRIKDFITRNTFARCVPYWTTPRWMFLEQPGKPSTFETGFTPISGTIFLPETDKLNINEFKNVNDRYHFTSVWQKYGGIIKNTIIRESCKNNNCSVAEEKTYNAEFKTKYDRQLIFLKPLINDPVNTSDTNCEINVKVDNKDNIATIKMNDPFGTFVPSSNIKGQVVDKTVKKEDDVDISNIDINVQPSETVNGNGKRYKEFFKKSELYRNIVGSGYFHPDWKVIGTTTNGKTTGTIINKGQTVKFIPKQNQYYYISGNLSHTSQAYCAIKLSSAYLQRETIYATALGVTAGGGVMIGVGIAKIAAVVTLAAGIALVATGVAMVTVVAPCIMMGAVSVSNKSSGGADTNGKMTLSYPKESKRQCGVGTAFKVVPIPQFACIKGYQLKCTNDRINKKYTAPRDIIEKCKSSAQTSIRTEPIPIGRCYKISYNIENNTIDGEKIQRYKHSGNKYLNTLIDATGTWDETENVYEVQCGLCVKSDDIYSYNGIYYLIGTIPDMPTNILTSDDCISYSGEEGEQYTWVTNINYIKPFDEYDGTTKNTILNDVKNKFLDTIKNNDLCQKDINFSPSVTNNDNFNTIKKAYLKASIRDLSSCISYISSLYNKFLSEITLIDDDCRTNVESKIESISSTICSQFKSRVENNDEYGGKYYYKYQFIQNQTMGSCMDDKNQYVEKANNNGFLPITSISNEQMLSKYGYGEFSANNINEMNASTFTLNLPSTIGGEKYKTATVGFAFAGNDDEDPFNLYKNYRISNEDDLQRGYQITVGSGNILTHGKHLYYYIQPYNNQNEPDPNFDPNVIFSPSKSGLTIDQIIQNEGVYSYKAWDVKDNGSALITMPRDGKLWLAILDSAEASNGETDGQYIMFNEDNTEGELTTSEGNYSGVNSGMYDVSGSIQTDKLDTIDSIVGSAKSNDGFASHTIFTAVIISPLKKILLGSYDSSKKTYKWETGILGQLSASFMRSHLLYIAWFLFAVFSIFVLSFGYLTGDSKVKFDFAFIKKYLWRYALIMAFLNPYSYDLYTKLFVRTTFALAEGLSAYAVGSFSSSTYNDLSPAGFTAVAFGPIDTIFRFWFRIETVEKMLAILFSSWTGWCSCIILILCLILFIISTIEALVLYVMILIKMSLYLAVGPIIFVTLLHESTSSKFYDWLKSLAGMIAEMVAMFTAVGIFATIYYHILKGSLNFIYCWEPIIKIPLLNITLFSMWRISGTLPAHMAELMGYNSSSSAISQGFNLINGFELLIITMMMSKFVDKSSSFGAKLFGQESSMPSKVKQITGEIKKQTINMGMDIIKKPAKALRDKVMNDEEKK